MAKLSIQLTTNAGDAMNQPILAGNAEDWLPLAANLANLMSWPVLSGSAAPSNASMYIID